ncbi:MAG: bifunctional riboflavin kinase/FAD synthetase [Chitinophagales bacterium]
MQVVRDVNHLPEFNKSVITIGTFDGVHTGHREIISKIRNAANQIRGKSIIITFHPHPRHILTPEQPVYYLTTLEEKIKILEQCHVDFVVVVPFSREFSEIEAEDYAENFLIKKFNPAVIVFGYDHKFGKDRSGDIHQLKEIANKYAIRVEEIPAYVIDNIAVSSSKIRKFLLEGNIAEANELLGYHYELTGHVVKGDQIGRTLGFPTANIYVEDENKLIPGDGVYVAEVEIKNRPAKYNGLLSIGSRPTFNKTEKRIEVYILDFDEVIYGETITVKISAFLRKDKKFNNAEELIDAMKADKKNALELLSKN